MISHRQADLLDLRHRFGIILYLAVNHSQPVGEGMFSIVSVIRKDEKFDVQRPPQLAFIHNLLQEYVKSHGDSPSIWHVSDWKKGVFDFVDFLEKDDHITNVEIHHEPSKGGVNADKNETYRIEFDIYSKTVPQDLT